MEKLTSEQAMEQIEKIIHENQLPAAIFVADETGVSTHICGNFPFEGFVIAIREVKEQLVNRTTNPFFKISEN